MAVPTRCQTPGTEFSVHIQDRLISIGISLPRPLYLDEDDAIILEANLHNALELALAPYFRRAK